MALIQRTDQGKFMQSHGGSRSDEYRIWGNMIHRCHGPASKSSAYYGGRGIKVCDLWRNSFEAFIRDVGPRPSREHSIDRINCDGDYEPGNCRWATAKQQALNRRNTIRLSGMTIEQVCAATGLPLNTVKGRLRRGWTTDRLMTQPRRNYPEATHAHR